MKIVRDSLRAREPSERRRALQRGTPSDRVRTVERAMHEGTWTIERCDYTEVRALAEALEISEMTASVLLRRGYRDVEEARAFFVGERAPHDPFLLGDMAVAVERIRAAIAAGKRICVHGDYDVDGICATALAVLTLRSSAPRSSGTCRAASRRATASRGRRSTGWPTTAAASC